MSSTSRGKAKKIAKTGARTFGGVIVLILKIIGTIILIGVTTSAIFACIFVIYVKTNLTSELGVNLKSFSLTQSSVIYYKDKSTDSYKELVTLQSPQYRIWVNYKDIPAYAEHALVAIEDKRFYKHNGVDWYRTFGAFGNMFLSMKDNFGGSTITQQLIKNLTEEDETTVQRKLLEIFRALQFEKEYSKQDIIEGYLNVVPFGGNTYGIGAAANYYFGKSAKDLTLAECASIIGITNNPSIYNPYINEKANKERQENILDEMYKQGYITTKAELDAAKAQKLNFVKGKSKNTALVTYTYYEDAVIEDVIADLKQLKGVSTKTAEDLLFSQGYKIYCSMDFDLQKKVDTIYQDPKAIPKVGGSTQPLQSAIVLADPYTGEILALEGGLGQKTISRSLNRATQTRRPPGSSIKPLAVYAPAMELGLITPDTRFEDSADVKLKGTSWMPNNDDWTYSGVISVRDALINSKNVVAAQIVDMLTPSKSYDFVKNKLDIKLDPADEDYAPMSLGQLTNGATVREMTQAYSMFDNNGVETHLITYSKLEEPDPNNKNGYHVLIDNKPKTTVAISPVTAYWITDMLQDAVAYGTGQGAYLDDLMPVAGKTGSTSDWKDRWFCGYTPYYVAVVWTGFDTPANMKVDFNPAANIWNQVMTLVSTGQKKKDFIKPDDTYLKPVPGVDAAVSYVVRCVDVDGNKVLQSNDKTGMPGKAVTEKAPEVKGYTVIGETDKDKEKTITLNKDSAKNVFEFYYKSTAPSPSASPSASPSGSPTPSGSTSPSASGSPGPSSSPGSSPSSSSSASSAPSPSPSPTTVINPSPSPSHSPAISAPPAASVLHNP